MVEKLSHFYHIFELQFYMKFSNKASGEYFFV